jgi:hypothetical protein
MDDRGRMTGERVERRRCERREARRRAVRLGFGSRDAVGDVDDDDDDDDDVDVESADGWEKMRGLARERASERRRRG